MRAAPRARVLPILQPHREATEQVMPIFVLILLLTAFPALSTDMYLPAIPLLCDLWGLPLAQVNLSLAAFFISFSAFLLVHGPLADRFGRRPVLVGGVAVYVVASLLCAGAANNTMLILARVLQALGASAAAAMSLTLAKDLYQGDARKKLLAYIGVIVPLCPMVAPTIGAFLLRYFSWSGIFVAQAVLALPALYGCLRLREPKAPDEGGAQAGSVLARYARLLRNKGFMAYAVSFAVLNMAFFSFIGGSAAIYISDFGLSEDLFGLFFAVNALAMMGGALLCSRLCVGIESGRILAVSLIGCLAGGALMFFLGGAQVFNRWGQLLYNGIPGGPKWDGTTLQGKAVPTGCYVYVINLFDGTPPITGNISVVY